MLHQDYTDNYQKNVICRALTQAVKRKDFYDSGIFTVTSGPMERLLSRENLNETETIRLNKYALTANLPGVFADAETWAADITTDIIGQMSAAGISAAWIGLDNWENAFINPGLT